MGTGQLGSPATSTLRRGANELDLLGLALKQACAYVWEMGVAVGAGDIRDGRLRPARRRMAGLWADGLRAVALGVVPALGSRIPEALGALRPKLLRTSPSRLLQRLSLSRWSGQSLFAFCLL